jgi:hypothetical protein
MKPLQNLLSFQPLLRFTKILLLSLLVFTGCQKSEPDAYEASKCYEATVIRGFCPSILVVTVTNANIGTDWKWEGKKYKNAITLSNFELSDSLAFIDSKIYFTIDTAATSADGGKCYLPKHCLQWAYDQSAPDASICIKSVSSKPFTAL